MPKSTFKVNIEIRRVTRTEQTQILIIYRLEKHLISASAVGLHTFFVLRIKEQIFQMVSCVKCVCQDHFTVSLTWCLSVHLFLLSSHLRVSDVDIMDSFHRPWHLQMCGASTKVQIHICLSGFSGESKRGEVNKATQFDLHCFNGAVEEVLHTYI